MTHFWRLTGLVLPAVLILQAGCPAPPADTDDCASPTDSFARMNDATYAIVVRYLTGEGAAGQSDAFIGTAFAIEPRLLVTNAHIARALIQNASPVLRVAAVQSGTGAVFDVELAIEHPGFDGVFSPDVALLQTRNNLPVTLPLANESDASDAALGDAVVLTGFPGDVQDLFFITLGRTVPQATALTGSVTARRSFDPTVPVTAGNLDILQHQVPTTPGTSGSPIVRCGEVIAVHNAGTVQLTIQVDPETGELVLARTAAASNNFGISVKYVHDLLRRVRPAAPEVVLRSLPPPDPTFVGTYVGALDLWPVVGVFDLNLSIPNRMDVTGSVLANGQFRYRLGGTVDRFGRIQLTTTDSFDDSPAIVLDGRFDAVSGVALGSVLDFESGAVVGVWRVELDL